MSSQTAAIADTFAAQRPQIDGYAEQFKYSKGAAGLAVPVGDNIVAVDLFDNPATCQRVWRRLSSFTLDAVGPETGMGQLTQPAVEGMLAALRTSSQKEVRPVKGGEEYRVKPIVTVHPPARQTGAAERLAGC